MQEHKSVKEMWIRYINRLTDVDKETLTYEAWHFCDNESDANELAELVKAGTKQATASLYELYEVEGELVPAVGDYSVIIKWTGEAQCVIRTTRVEVVPYSEVGEAFAAKEGEGDGSLAYWRKEHWPYFKREMEALGKEPNEEMLVVCEEFEVVGE